MNREDAEEYTQSLGQITRGAWRQVALAQRLGVPKALGLGTEEWVQQLGGYVRLAVPERREAVKELTAPVEDGGQGLSRRRAAEVLGVAESTVRDDLNGARNRAPDEPGSGISDGGGARFRAEDGEPTIPPGPDGRGGFTHGTIEAVLERDPAVKERLDRSRLRAQFSAAVAAWGGVLLVEPRYVAEALGPERYEETAGFAERMRAWLDGLAEVGRPGIRLVKE